MALRPGDILAGKYEIISEIGEGGFGKTYLGHDLGMDRPVAIKELLHSSATTNPEEYEEYQTRFRKEARIVSRFSHPNVVAAYALESDEEGNLYLILEYVGGGSLKSLLETGRLMTNEQVISLGIDICNAIEAIYRRDIVHRDIKPGNILLTEDGQAKLTDFGVAQLGHETRRTQTARGHPGTPAYKSPEQANTTGYLDERSDLYSLGLVMYEMLTGKLYVRNLIPPEAYNPDVSPLLSRIIMRALEENPIDRYQSAAEMREDLQRLRDRGLGNRVRIMATLVSESPLFRVALPALVVLAIAALAWGVWQVADRMAVVRFPTPTFTTAATARTPVPTFTPLPTNTLPSTATSSLTNTPLPSPTPTSTGTASPSATATGTPTPTNTATLTPTNTQVPTETPVLVDLFEPDDIEPKPIGVGETQTHNFYPANDVDKVTFRAKAGRWYAISTGNLAVGVDTRLEVWVVGELYENDDAEPGQLASLVRFRSPAEAMIIVTITNLDQFGPDKRYDITVVELPPTLTPTPTASPTVTGTPSPTTTSTLSPTATPTATPTSTYTFTPTETPSPTATQTPIPTWTWTPTITQTASPTATETPIPTNTPTQTSVPTETHTPTETPIPTTEVPTQTPTPTDTPTETAVPPGGGGSREG